MNESVTDFDRRPRGMVEGCTEYEWDELPDYVKNTMRVAARELYRWVDMQDSPIVGELANEIEAGK